VYVLLFSYRLLNFYDVGLFKIYLCSMLFKLWFSCAFYYLFLEFLTHNYFVQVRHLLQLELGQIYIFFNHISYTIYIIGITPETLQTYFRFFILLLFKIYKRSHHCPYLLRNDWLVFCKFVDNFASYFLLEITTPFCIRCIYLYSDKPPNIILFFHAWFWYLYLSTKAEIVYIITLKDISILLKGKSIEMN
jgi:hypothetical protein